MSMPSRKTFGFLLTFLIAFAVGLAVTRYVVPRFAPEIGSFYAADETTCGEAGYYSPGDVCGEATPGGSDPVCDKKQQWHGMLFEWPGYCWSCDGGDLERVCGGGGPTPTPPGDGPGGSCDRDNMSATFNGGTVTIHNGNGVGCDVHATSWEVYDRFLPEFLDTQVQVSAPTGHVGPHGDISFNVTIPDCSHQVDAGTGNPPSNAHYGGNYIDGRITFTDYLCDGTCIGDSCQPHHMACQNNACVQVDGAGSDQCSNNAQCAPVPSSPPPIGSFDEVTCVDLQGWARDPDTDPLPSDNNGPVHVTIWNGPATPGGANMLAEVIADRPREPAVGNHAFLWPIPAALKNGQTYNFYVYARDNQNPAVSTLLIGSPRTLDTSTCLAAPPTASVAAVCDTPDITRMSVSWTTTGTPTTNILERSTNGGAYAVIFQESGPPFNRNSYADTQIALGNTYGYRVQVAPGVYSNVATVNATAQTCGVPTPTHLECVSNSCTSVSGAGTNTCSTVGSSCGVASTHLECVSNACTQVSGAGTDACTPVGSACGITPTHLECVSNSCTQVSGAGTNTCSPAGSSCGTAELVCAPTSQNATSGQSVTFTASGGRSPYVWSAPGGNPSSLVGNPFSARFSNTNTSPRTFTATVTDQDGRTDFCTVSVTCVTPSCNPSPGCSYQGGNLCSCGTLTCPSDSPLVCAPTNQTVSIGQSAIFQAAGGTGSYTWTAPGSATFSPNGQLASTTYSSAGSYTVTVRDSQNHTASCAVQVPTTVTPPPTSPALAIAKTVRNVTTNGPDTEIANADPSQTVEFTIRVSSVGSGTATQVIVRDTLPAGLTYSTGTTTIDGTGAADGIIGSGLLIGDMAPGRVVVIRFRAVLANASFFGTGTTTLINTAFARGSNTNEISDNAQVRIVRGTTTPTQVPTGPGESAILALIVSAIATLLYVGYASTESFSRHEAESLARKGKDNIDSLDFRR